MNWNVTQRPFSFPLPQTYIQLYDIHFHINIQQVFQSKFRWSIYFSPVFQITIQVCYACISSLSYIYHHLRNHPSSFIYFLYLIKYQFLESLMPASEIPPRLSSMSVSLISHTLTYFPHSYLWMVSQPLFLNCLKVP